MSAHLPRGQTLDSRWVGESGRYLQRSGKTTNKEEEEGKRVNGDRRRSVRKKRGSGNNENG